MDKDSKLNILIPMAGNGSRFAKAGYTFPKPLIEIHQKPMIEWVVRSLNIPNANYIYLVRKEHSQKYNIDYVLEQITPGCDIIELDQVTDGAVCTTLLAKGLINNDTPLLIANSDQFVKWNSRMSFDLANKFNLDGFILTFKAVHPKWSFVRLNEIGNVVEVAEKRPISNIATTGIYWWKHGSNYVKYAEQMIRKNIRVNNEFYVCPVFNEAIADNKIISSIPVTGMWGLGTPEDLKYFIDNYKGGI